MLTILLLISQFSIKAEAQCMLLLNNYIKGNSPHRKVLNTRLVDCMDDCLTNRLHSCEVIVYDHIGKTCLLHEDHEVRKREGNVVMQKMNCTHEHALVDFRCFDYDTHKYRDMKYLYGIGSRSDEECRRICMLTVHCKGYTWLPRSKRCGLAVYSKKSTRNLDDGEVAAFVRPKCNNNRCTFLKFNSWSANEVVNDATSFVDCYHRLLQYDKIQIVDWRYQQSACSYHTKADATVYDNSRKQLQAIKHGQCNGKAPDACVEKTPNTEMEGGFLIKNMAEQDCVTLCLHAVNCAAVTWSRDRNCKFHHVIRKTHGQKSKYTVYNTENCTVQKVTRTLFTNHYAYKGTKPVAEKFSPSCFKCAFRCQLDQCPSFTCFKEGQSQPDLCTLDGSSEHSYVPKN